MDGSVKSILKKLNFYDVALSKDGSGSFIYVCCYLDYTSLLRELREKYTRALISVEVFKIDLELIDSVVDNIGFSVYNFELDSAYNDLHLLAEDIIVSKLSGIG